MKKKYKYTINIFAYFFQTQITVAVTKQSLNAVTPIQTETNMTKQQQIRF